MKFRKDKNEVFIEKWNKQLEHLEYILNKNKDSDKLSEVKDSIELIRKELKKSDE